MKTRVPTMLTAALSALILSSVLSFSVQAQEKTLEAKLGRIAVTGQGFSSAKPDTAILNLSVLREADTAREALAANNEAMAKVLDAMKTAGIEDRDLQTGGFSIQPRYIYPDDKNNLKEPTITGYSVSNTLNVRVRNLAKVGTILDKSVSLGVNQGGDITFVNDDSTNILNEARKNAVKDAINKATILAEAAGVHLGRVIEMSEQGRQPTPIPMTRNSGMMEMAQASSKAVPIAIGENKFDVYVNMVFEIKP